MGRTTVAYVFIYYEHIVLVKSAFIDEQMGIWPNDDEWSPWLMEASNTRNKAKPLPTVV